MKPLKLFVWNRFGVRISHHKLDCHLNTFHSPGTKQASIEHPMIRHTVVFELKHASGSQAEHDFLQSARRLAEIPTVKKFECLRQVSKKNSYAFGLSMEFASPEDYQVYNDHPDHVHFVQTRWFPEVVDFLEIDYEPIC
jgi:hypothetical protein